VSNLQSTLLPNSPPKPILTKAAPLIFHGREEFVTDIVRTMLQKKQAQVPILGAGGMGKTSIALAVANDPAIVEKFGNRRHFIPCEEAPEPGLLIALIADQLGIQVPTANPFAHILATLRTSDTLSLLVLDNFETPWDTRSTQSQIEDIVLQLACVPSLSPS
jgi:Cdc6-like AAA superfamily ATPase